jgi:CBS domain-containing protein
MARSEFEDEYDAALEGEEHTILGSALLKEPIRELEPSDPIFMSPDASVHDAVKAMKDGHQGAVLITDGGAKDGALRGIFSERDLVTRVVGADKDVRATRLRDVMTPNPETVTADDLICFALNRMSVKGYRNIPVVDPSGKAVGIVVARHFAKFIAALFPEAVLNLPPTQNLKHPELQESG